MQICDLRRFATSKHTSTDELLGNGPNTANERGQRAELGTMGGDKPRGVSPNPSCAAFRGDEYFPTWDCRMPSVGLRRRFLGNNSWVTLFSLEWRMGEKRQDITKTGANIRSLSCSKWITSWFCRNITHRSGRAREETQGTA